MLSLASEVRRLRASVVARNAAWMFAGQGTSYVLRVIYFVLLARMLGSGEYGVFVGAVAYASIASQYSGLGSGVLFLRYVSQDRNRFGEYWGNILASILISGTLLSIGLAMLARHLTHGNSWFLMLLVASSECLWAKLAQACGQVFQAFERLRITALLNIAGYAMRLAAVAYLGLRSSSLVAVRWAEAAWFVSLASAVVTSVAVTLAFGLPRFNLRLTLRSIPEGFGFSFAGSTSVFYNDIDKGMLSHAGQDTANGIYSLAYRIVDMATLPVMAIDLASMPRFFRDGNEGVHRGKLLASKIIKRTSLLGLLVAVLLFAAAPVIPRMTGTGFTASIQALRWLCLIPFFRGFQMSAGAALTGAGYQNVRTAMQVLAGVMNFCLNLVLIPRFSWLGCAWASLATDAAIGALNWTALLYLAGSFSPKTAM